MSRNIIVLFILTVLLEACSYVQVESGEARVCAEGFLTALRDGHTEHALGSYATSFDETMTPEKRLEKLNELKKVTGPMTAFELTDSSKTTSGDFPAYLLTYLVSYEKVKTIEKFEVIKEEGVCKISGHDIKSINQ